jgi:RNase P protein component
VAKEKKASKGGCGRKRRVGCVDVIVVSQRRFEFADSWEIFKSLEEMLRVAGAGG